MSRSLKRANTSLSMRSTTKEKVPNLAFAAHEGQEGKDGNQKSWKRIAKAVFKHLLLVVANCAVLVGGAYLFQYLESENEVENCRNQRQEYEIAIGNTNDLMKVRADQITGMKEVTDEAKAKLEVDYRRYLNEYAAQIYKIKYKFHVCENLAENTKWSFSNSLMFTLTVMTTIGYGAIAPATKYGRIICIIYGFLSIPLYMIALASIGEGLAKMFKKFYWFACCCGWCKKEEQDTTDEIEEVDKNDEEKEEEDFKRLSDITVPLIVTMSVLLGFVFLGAGVFLVFETKWKFVESIYYSFITISTIGFGDVVPAIDLSNGKDTGKLIVVILYITFGLAAISMCFQLMADEILAKFVWIGEKCGLNKKLSLDDEDENDNSSNDQQSEQSMPRISGLGANKPSLRVHKF